MQESNEPINPATTNARYIARNYKDFEAKFANNSVSTAKYDVFFITFLPIFLFEVFSRVAYLYFLIQVRLPTEEVSHNP